MPRDLCRASRDERNRLLPGDDLVPNPMGTVTYAVTIAAPPHAVWPWIVQLGSGRAGWYAYDRIDNGGKPSARRIIPELQHVAVGDVLPWLPGATDGFVIRELIPERALVLVALLQPSGGAVKSTGPAPPLRTSWALVLEPLADERTRLLTRGRVSRDWLAPGATASRSGTPTFIERIYALMSKLPRPLLLIVAGFGDYLMQARMLRGIKRRAERAWTDAVLSQH